MPYGMAARRTRHRREGDIIQGGQPPVALVVGKQDLAAPDRAVGAEAGSVEGKPQHRFAAVAAVLGHHRSDMGMVMLHGAHRAAPALRCAQAADRYRG